MKAKLDMDKIAKALGAERRGPIAAKGGYFGAAQLAKEVSARLRIPEGGGRGTDPAWTERRPLPLKAETLTRLEGIAARIREHTGKEVHPMQIAAILLEKTAQEISDEEAERVVGGRRAAR
jgi:hypothetical protein